MPGKRDENARYREYLDKVHAEWGYARATRSPEYFRGTTDDEQ